MTVQDEIKSLMEAEMVEGGKLEGLKSVVIGDITLIPAANYPCAMIISEPGKMVYNGNHLLIEKNFVIVIHVIEDTIEKSEEIRDELIIRESNGSFFGMMPFLKTNMGIQAGDLRYALSFSDINTGTGPNSKGRDTAAAEIPVKLTTRINL